MKIVLINAAPRAGKDTLAKEIQFICAGGAEIHKFADELKGMTHRLYATLDASNAGDYLLREPSDYFEECKDRPRLEFLGITPRQAYIGVSELLMKPLFGKDIFGRILADKVAAFEGSVDVVLVSDSGFAEEARVLVDRFGAQNVYLVRLLRPGTSFANDSRSHLEPEAIGVPASNFLVLRNEGPRESVRVLADHVVKAFDL